MSRLKDINTNPDVLYAIQSISNSQVVTPAEDAETFGGIIDMSADEDAAKKKESNQQGSKSHEMGVDSKRKKKSSKADHVKDVDDGEDKAAVESETKLNDEEQAEIDKYKIDVAELAHQLNLSFDQIKQQIKKEGQIELINAANKVTTQKIKPAENISPELLSKIDVETLRKQMELIMAQKETGDLNSEAPKEMIVDEFKDYNLQGELNGVGIADNEGPKLNTEKYIKTDGSNLDGILQGPGFKQSTNLNSALNVEVPKLFNNALTGQTTVEIKGEAGPEIVLEIVAVDLSLLNEGKDEIKELILIPVDELDLEDIIDFKTQNMFKMFENSKLGQKRLDISPQFATLNPIDGNQMAVNMSHLLPLREKVSEIVVQMSRIGKSGITRIQIFPPELGAINIKFSVQGDKVKVEIMTEQLATKAFLEGNMPHLKEILMAEKLEVTNFDVVHDKDFFKSESQKILSDFAREQQQKYGSEYSQNSETKREEIEKLKELIAESVKRNKGSGKKLDLMA